MKYLNKYDLHFCVRRLPRKLKYLMQKHGSKIVVAGGYIRSVVASERVSDIDVFAGDKNASEILATELQGNDTFYRTDNAFTVTKLPLTVQFIFRWVYDEPIDIVKSFDFTICQAAFWYDTKQTAWNSICGDYFYEDLCAKRLRYLSPDRNEDAGGSMLRVLKYYQRGYRIPLDSLAAVIARLIRGIEIDHIHNDEFLSDVICGLLFEVDPAGFIDHQAYLPPEGEL